MKYRANSSMQGDLFAFSSPFLLNSEHYVPNVMGIHTAKART